MTVFEKMRGKQIPAYYDTMYMDGYQPHEIIEAAHNSIVQQYEARQAESATPEPMNVKFRVEVVKK